MAKFAEIDAFFWRQTMLDRMTFRVNNLRASQAFYVAALKPLGYSLAYEGEHDGRQMVGLGYPDANAHGGMDNGAPSLRPHYHQYYYGAFVFDPEGNNVEAVCHLPL